MFLTRFAPKSRRHMLWMWLAIALATTLIIVLFARGEAFA